MSMEPPVPPLLSPTHGAWPWHLGAGPSGGRPWLSGPTEGTDLSLAGACRHDPRPPSPATRTHVYPKGSCLAPTCLAPAPRGPPPMGRGSPGADHDAPRPHRHWPRRKSPASIALKGLSVYCLASAASHRCCPLSAPTWHWWRCTLRSRFPSGPTVGAFSTPVTVLRCGGEHRGDPIDSPAAIYCAPASPGRYENAATRHMETFSRRFTGLLCIFVMGGRGLSKLADSFFWRSGRHLGQWQPGAPKLGQCFCDLGTFSGFFNLPCDSRYSSIGFPSFLPINSSHLVRKGVRLRKASP